MAKYDENMRFYCYGNGASIRQRLNLADKNALEEMGADFQRATLEVELRDTGVLKILMKIYSKSNGHQYNVVSNCTISKIKYLNPKSPYSANIINACTNLKKQINTMIRAAQFAVNVSSKSGFCTLQHASVNMLNELIPNFKHIPQSDGSTHCVAVYSDYDYALRHCFSQIISLAFANAEFISGQTDEFVPATDKSQLEQIDSYVNLFNTIAEQAHAENANS